MKQASTEQIMAGMVCHAKVSLKAQKVKPRAQTEAERKRCIELGKIAIRLGLHKIPHLRRGNA